MSRPVTARRLGLRGLLSLVLLGLLVILYAIGAAIIYGFESRERRTDLHYLLYSEAEAMASYIASTGRLDFPELMEVDDGTPLPIWLRVVQNGRPVAATPGTPPLPETLPPPREGEIQPVTADDGTAMARVVHDVWNQPGVLVEAYSRLDALEQRTRRLLLTLLLTSLILAPLAVGASLVVTGYALRPLRRLMTSIRGIDDTSLDARLDSGSSIEEVALLTREFNSLLERIERSVLHLRRFTANASHELRTPVSALRTTFEVCLRRPHRDEVEYRTVLGDSLREIERLQRTIESLLALAREPDAEGPDHEPVDLTQVLEVARGVLAPLAEERDLRVDVAVDGTVDDEPSPRVLGDAALLELMVVNLLDNAVKHSPRGGAVQVDVTTRDEATLGDGAVGPAVVLRITDQGPGIPADQRALIFERHFQGGELPRSSRSGGIGLDLVRWVVLSHRGTVRLVEPEVEAPAGARPAGAVFEVVLPRA